MEPHLGGSHFLLCPFLVCVTFGRLWALSEPVSSPVKGEYCCFSLLLCRLGTVTQPVALSSVPGSWLMVTNVPVEREGDPSESLLGLHLELWS